MQMVQQGTSHERKVSPASAQAAWFKQSKPLGNAIADRGIKVTVKPNPADTWAAFDYELPAGILSGTITISNNQGQIINNIQIVGSKGQVVWDTRSIASGQYLYILRTSSGNKSGSIIVN